MQTLISLLENNFQSFSDKISQIENLDLKKPRIHIDLITSGFVDNNTLLLDQWPKIDNNCVIDVHLMADNPQSFLTACKAKNVNCIIAHLEKLKNLQSWVDKVEQKKLRAGVAVDLDTEVKNFVLPLSKNKLQILLMSVKSGFSGQTFNSLVLKKIRLLREIIGNKAEIIIDGGINFENAKKCQQSDADGVVINSWLWEDLKERYEKVSLI